MTKSCARSALALALLGSVAIWQPTTASAQVLQLAVDGSPAGLDPHIVTAFNSMQIVLGPVYEGLTSIDKDLHVVPGLS